MRVKVDGEKCLGHTMCTAVASEVYEVSGTGFNTMGEFEVDESARAAVLRGAGSCPEQAISILSDD